MKPFKLRAAALFICALMALTSCGERAQKAPVLNYGNDGGAGSAGVHTVSAGETLWDIAQRYNMDMKDVIYKNHLSPPYLLEVGARLELPPPNTYKVRAGDTLYDIARMFDVSQTQLAQQNKLSAPYHINRGDTLRLPSIEMAEYRPVNIESPEPDAQPIGPKTAAKPVAPVERKPLVNTKDVPTKAGRYIWPVDGPVISNFGPKKDGLHNDGINIKAAKGTTVRASENGVIAYADSQLKGYGNLILIRHAERWVTAYAHLDRMSVKVGDKVRQGDVIGTVGRTGNVNTPQLHFEIRRGTNALNPMQYLPAQGT